MIPAIVRMAWMGLTCCWCRVKGEEAPSELNVFVHGESQVKAPKADISNQKVHSTAVCGPLLKDIFQLCIQMAVIMYWECERGFWFSVNLHHTKTAQWRETLQKCRISDLKNYRESMFIEVLHMWGE